MFHNFQFVVWSRTSCSLKFCAKQNIKFCKSTLTVVLKLPTGWFILKRKFILIKMSIKYTYKACKINHHILKSPPPTISKLRVVALSHHKHYHHHHCSPDLKLNQTNSPHYHYIKSDLCTTDKRWRHKYWILFKSRILSPGSGEILKPLMTLNNSNMAIFSLYVLLC